MIRYEKHSWVQNFEAILRGYTNEKERGAFANSYSISCF